MTKLPVADVHADTEASAHWALSLIEHRQTVLPKRLAEPGPDSAQLDAMLRAAAAAPDHGELVPWRFVTVPATARARLGDAFAAALAERDPLATPEQMEQAREKAFRAPLLMLAVVRMGGAAPEVPPAERLLSAGCAVQNMLLMATAMGFGSALTSGKAMTSTAIRELFGLTQDEHAVCFVSIGTAAARKKPRDRPLPASFASTLGA